MILGVRFDTDIKPWSVNYSNKESRVDTSCTDPSQLTLLPVCLGCGDFELRNNDSKVVKLTGIFLSLELRGEILSVDHCCLMHNVRYESGLFDKVAFDSAVSTGGNPNSCTCLPDHILSVLNNLGICHVNGD